MLIETEVFIEGELIELLDRPMPDEKQKDMPKVLQEPYIATIKITKIYSAPGNPEVVHHLLNKEISINSIFFRKSSLEETVKKGGSFYGWLNYTSIELHGVGYKTTIGLQVVRSKD